MSITSFRIREELKDPLEQAAKDLSLPDAWIINEARASYFKRDHRDQRMYRETLDGLADVQAGRVIDREQVQSWIESWGSDKELPSPRS